MTMCARTAITLASSALITGGAAGFCSHTISNRGVDLARRRDLESSLASGLPLGIRPMPGARAVRGARGERHRGRR